MNTNFSFVLPSCKCVRLHIMTKYTTSFLGKICLKGIFYVTTYSLIRLNLIGNTIFIKFVQDQVGINILSSSFSEPYLYIVSITSSCI